MNSPRSISIDDFRQLYYKLNSFVGNKPRRRMQFVSAIHGSGTSLVARDFALVAATQETRPVLLLDLTTGPGSQFEWMSGHFSRRASLLAQCNLPGLPAQGPWISPDLNGDRPSEPSFRCHWIFADRIAVSENRGTADLMVLGTKRLDAFWSALHDTFGLIVVDCPPRSDGPECLALAPHMDATIPVISAEDTRVPVARRLRDELTDAGATIAGAVFNKRQFHIPPFIYRRLGA